MRYTLIPSAERDDPPSPEEALDVFLSTWGGDTLYDVGCSLTCHETEALADLLAAHGEYARADMLREGHITGDDSGDLNHNTHAEWTDEELAALPEGADNNKCVHSA